MVDEWQGTARAETQNGRHITHARDEWVVAGLCVLGDTEIKLHRGTEMKQKYLADSIVFYSIQF